MGHGPHASTSVDSQDIVSVCGFACIVAGVAWRYDGALALIVFGIGLLLLGSIAAWRKS
jgi:hypothetical protein